ncbi:MAG: branched-chain amino acid ABC transporter substrate-binding protein [Candidatus Rokubacteria bacterium]|nr:branched-chain amino acid ABC transporter substrate-binding protein [Candidatus Rokubacteria bacterium]
MKRYWRIAGLGAALLALLVWAPAGDAAKHCPKGKMKFYTSWPMQGAMIPESDGMRNGVKMAVEEAGGAVSGYCIEVINLDDASPQTGKWDGAVEAENANKAVADKDAMVYIATYNSGAAKVSIPITNRARMMQITPANTYPGLTKKIGAAPGEPEMYRPTGVANYLRHFPADDIQGAVGARWAKAMGHKKVFILDDQELYGKGVADVFDIEAKKIGLQVVGHEGIDWKQPDQKPVLTKIRATGADLIYMGGVIETGVQVIVRQMKDLGLVMPKVRFMGADGFFQDELFKGAGCESVEAVGFRMTFASLPFEQLTGVGGKAYRMYKDKFKIEPSSYALYAYDAARIAIEAVKRAGKKEREAIRKAAFGIKDYEGINGKFSFDENGDSDSKIMSGYGVEKCKFKFLQVLQF